jgi:hypothetical protein
MEVAAVLIQRGLYDFSPTAKEPEGLKAEIHHELQSG